MKRLLLVGIVCLLALPLFAQEAAEEKKPEEPVEFTGMAEVRLQSGLAKSYAVQGEYVAKEGPDGQKRALQVIADGGNKYRYAFFTGGLPGDGWKPGMLRGYGTLTFKSDDQFEFTAEAMLRGDPEENILSSDAKEKTHTGKFESMPAESGGDRRARNVGKIIFPAQASSPETVFEKVRRRSPTLGAKAPEGAYVVFDGTNLDNFEPSAKMNDTPSGRTQGKTLWSEAVAKPFEKDKPYTLHLEFMLSYMPTKRGQARSNSGVYIAECYECQILDSFGHVPPQNNECGGFYKVQAPAINMCFPPLTWQTYDIDFTPAKFENGQKTANARVTVKHNGVTIQDNVELPKETPGRKKEADEARGLYLQGHGNKVQFRNIWVAYH